ncbi:MAG: hypothetical protein QOF14_4385 [Hyphomicrobiales bacterium]|jgi:hypothetical protein|nr:hypothetical protein [Hyphomicrobiales bacterium]
MHTSIRCPKTREAIPIDLKDGRADVVQGWHESFNLKCPHCGELHTAKYRDLYVAGVLSGFQGDFDGLLRAFAKP